jgi:hypothetical protein
MLVKSWANIKIPPTIRPGFIPDSCIESFEKISIIIIGIQNYSFFIPIIRIWFSLINVLNFGTSKSMIVFNLLSSASAFVPKKG